MTLTPEKLDALYALALRAPLGPWEAKKVRTVIRVGGFSNVCDISTSAKHVHEDYPGVKANYIRKQEATAAYIAAVSPDVVTAIIDENKSQKEEIARLRTVLDDLIRDHHSPLDAATTTYFWNQARAALNKE